MDVDSERGPGSPVGPEGPAAHQAPGRQRQTGPEAVFGEGFDGVGGAARIEAAGRDPARGRALVGGDQGHRHPYGQAAPRSRDRSRQPPCLGRLFSERRLDVVAERRGLPARPRRARGAPGRPHGPGAVRVERTTIAGAPCGAHSARRRCRSAPNCVCHLGKHPASSVATGRNVTRTGPLAPRARERCSSAKAAAAGDASDRPWGHERPSDGETVAPLEPP